MTGRLRRDGHERGMGVHQSGRRIEARIRHAPEADAAAVARHLGEQPLDGVPRVGALVGRAGAAGGGVERPHLRPFAFRQEPAADVLLDDDEPAVLEARRRAQGPGERAVAVRRHAVRRARQHDGEAGAAPLRGRQRHVDGRVQLHAVAHRDLVLVLREARRERECLRARRRRAPRRQGAPPRPGNGGRA